jgi:hypothetical protein
VRFILRHWQLLLAARCARVNRRRLKIINFKNTGGDAVNQRSRKKRMLLADDRRCLSAVQGHALARKVLLELTAMLRRPR